MDRAREANLELNRHKLRLWLSIVMYMWHQLTAQGTSPDSNKVNTIVNMPRPVDKKGTERLQGNVTYLSRFLSKLSDVVSPLRLLTERDVIFAWLTDWEQAFNTVKQMVTTAPVTMSQRK